MTAEAPTKSLLSGVEGVNSGGLKNRRFGLSMGGAGGSSSRQPAVDNDLFNGGEEAEGSDELLDER